MMEIPTRLIAEAGTRAQASICHRLTTEIGRPQSSNTFGKSWPKKLWPMHIRLFRGQPMDGVAAGEVIPIPWCIGKIRCDLLIAAAPSRHHGQPSGFPAPERPYQPTERLLITIIHMRPQAEAKINSPGCGIIFKSAGQSGKAQGMRRLLTWGQPKGKTSPDI